MKEAARRCEYALDSSASNSRTGTISSKRAPIDCRKRAPRLWRKGTFPTQGSVVRRKTIKASEGEETKVRTHTKKNIVANDASSATAAAPALDAPAQEEAQAGAICQIHAPNCGRVG